MMIPEEVLTVIKVLTDHIYKCNDQSILGKYMRTEDEIENYQKEAKACVLAIKILEERL